MSSSQSMKTPIRRRLGDWPSPVYEAKVLREGLWVKNDGICHGQYAGNKVRKLEYLLPPCGRQIVTMGAVGSHHVLATAIHGGALGHQIQAVVFPRPYSVHAEQVLQATVARADLVFEADWTSAQARFEALSRRASAIPAGGSSVLGAMGYVDAMLELQEQIESGVMPCPRRIFVPVGTAGTLAGMVAGLGVKSMPTEIIGIRVVPEAWLARSHVAALCRATADALGVNPGSWRLLDGFLGAGYGCATSEGREAIRRAEEVGLALECCYTGKALAAALQVSEGPDLYWQTGSQRDLEPLLEGVDPVDRTAWGW